MRNTFILDSAVGKLTVSATLVDCIWDNVACTLDGGLLSLDGIEWLEELLVYALLEGNHESGDVLSVAYCDDDGELCWCWADQPYGEVVRSIDFVLA